MGAEPQKHSEDRATSDVHRLGPVNCLLVDPEPNMARFHREQLAAASLPCDIAHSAAQAIERASLTSFEVAFVSLGFSRSALKEVVAALRRAGIDRIYGIAFDDRNLTLKGLDIIVVKPTPPAILAKLTRGELPPPNARPPADLVPELIEVSALGPDRERLTRVASMLTEGLGAEGAIIYSERPRRRWVALRGNGDRIATAARLETIVRQCAASGSPFIAPATVTAQENEQRGERAETIYAWRSQGSEGLTLALVFRDCIILPQAVRRMAEALTRRLTDEVAWQLVQERLMTELDAVRDVGGLDPLLGVWNRGMLNRLVEMMQSAGSRSGRSLAVAVIDVVRMGEINDQFGHSEGDAVLKYVAEVIVYVVRTHDVVARYDGDALAVVFDGASLEQAERVLTRFQSTLSSQPYQTEEGDEITIKASAGLAVLASDGDPDRAFDIAAQTADRAEAGTSVVASIPQDGTERVSTGSEPSLAGRTLGGAYRILHEIGSGGGGGVYRGEDLALRRPVAVKVLRPDLARDEELVERFRDEAATLAALRHPYLVQVYSFGVEDGLAYFVMELVEGESLFQTIQRCRKEMTRISVGQVAVIVAQLASALQTLHQSGIHHRDVKPANVLLDPFRDRAVLVDVGIASRAGEQSVMAGTPGYMAPEAATEKTVDDSADVYGLAATIYELLTLTPPWLENEDPIVVLRRQQAGPPRPPSRYRADIAAVDDVMIRALEPKPRHRFPDVRAFALALREALREIDDSIPSSTIGVPDSTRGPATPMTLGSAPTMSWSHAIDSSQANTRGVVFRSLARVVGARHAIAWRVELGRHRPQLAEALSPSAPPLGWLPTPWLMDLLKSPPAEESRTAAALGYDLGRATVRATFRRFFPASVATLSPQSVLQALPQIWRQYHSWGDVLVGPPRPDGANVFLRRGLDDPTLASWLQGMLEQLVELAGADEVSFSRPDDVELAHDNWTFEGRWAWSPGSDRPWR